ncbi:MAG TPA: hypothetical protein VHU44_14800 [Acidobacteriaceae bacterium]|nr:hypothetical protein [Acidobacteriaceae bacterium]
MADIFAQELDMPYKKEKEKSLAPTWSIERDRNPIVSPTSQPRSQARRKRVSLDGRSRRASSTLSL